jgi:hypothetical protein
MKTVAILSDSPELKALCEEIEAVRKEFDQKLQFIRKQADDAAKSGREKEKPIMDTLRQKLREKGKLPDDKLTVDYDLQGDNITVGEASPQSLLSALFGIGK